MIGKILGGVLGAKAAEQSGKVGGAGGAVLGVAAATMLRRLSFPALLAVTAGGYAFKKWSDRREAPSAPAPKGAPRKPRKSPAKPG